MTTKQKPTSADYSEEYQLGQYEKYKNRTTNHWHIRIALFRDLLEKCSSTFIGIEKKDITVVDVGCSVGTFAIEAAKMGYRSYGIDFDSNAISIARRLAQEVGVSPTFVVGDVSDWKNSFQSIDIAVCMDIFEHLHDDELGAFLYALRRSMSNRGVLLFHTFPSQYDYLLFHKPIVSAVLFPFAFMPKVIFQRALRVYAKLLDICLILAKDKDYLEHIEEEHHCNPITSRRIRRIFERAGYSVDLLEAAQLFPFKAVRRRLFQRHPTAARNIYGIARPVDQSKFSHDGPLAREK